MNDFNDGFISRKQWPYINKTPHLHTLIIIFTFWNILQISGNGFSWGSLNFLNHIDSKYENYPPLSQERFPDSQETKYRPRSGPSILSSHLPVSDAPSMRYNTPVSPSSIRYAGSVQSVQSTYKPQVASNSPPSIRYAGSVQSNVQSTYRTQVASNVRRMDRRGVPQRHKRYATNGYFWMMKRCSIQKVKWRTCLNAWKKGPAP